MQDSLAALARRFALELECFRMLVCPVRRPDLSEVVGVLEMDFQSAHMERVFMNQIRNILESEYKFLDSGRGISIDRVGKQSRLTTKRTIMSRYQALSVKMIDCDHRHIFY